MRLAPGEIGNQTCPDQTPQTKLRVPQARSFAKGMKNAFYVATTFHGSATLPFVIPTGAYPDFLPRCTGQGRVCAFL
jgi:hypothetical protein